MREQESRIDRYMTMINNHVITSETDLHGNVTYVSSAFCNISGYTKEELIGKKICKAIESLNIPHEYNSASDFVTASFAVISTSSNQALEMDQLYSEADKALYQAKESGRNRVCYSE